MCCGYLLQSTKRSKKYTVCSNKHDFLSNQRALWAAKTYHIILPNSYEDILPDSADTPFLLAQSILPVQNYTIFCGEGKNQCIRSPAHFGYQIFLTTTKPE
jgi:hypothetical protein